MLTHRWHAEQGLAVVFLHGLLGSQQDWQAVIDRLLPIGKIRPLTLDLPFHGESQLCHCHDFQSMRILLASSLQHILGNQPFWLVGYSLGGRIALDYSLNINTPQRLGTILEGVNLGIKDEHSRLARWQNDCLWAKRFENEPLVVVLNDWYQQPVFAYLSNAQRQKLIQQRQDQCGRHIAQMLRATSLAKQPYYADQPCISTARLHHFLGSLDHKFHHQAEQLQIPHHLIPLAGHNAHWENPTAFVQALQAVIFA